MARTKGAKNKPKKNAVKKSVKKAASKAKAAKKVVTRKKAPKSRLSKAGRKKKKSASDLSGFLIVDSQNNFFRDDDTFGGPNSLATSKELVFEHRPEAKAALKQMRADYDMGILPSHIGDALKSAEVKAKKDLYTVGYSVTENGNIESELFKLPLEKGAQVVSLKSAVLMHVQNLKGIVASRKEEVQDTIRSLKTIEKELAKFLKTAKAYK